MQTRRNAADLTSGSGQNHMMASVHTSNKSKEGWEAKSMSLILAKQECVHVRTKATPAVHGPPMTPQTHLSRRKFQSWLLSGAPPQTQWKEMQTKFWLWKLCVENTKTFVCYYNFKLASKKKERKKIERNWAKSNFSWTSRHASWHRVKAFFWKWLTEILWHPRCFSRNRKNIWKCQATPTYDTLLSRIHIPSASKQKRLHFTGTL